MSHAPYKKEHADTKGPGDARPTASQIVTDQGLVDKLKGVVILVTGATAGGLGAETIKSLRATGADIYFTARSEEKVKAAMEDIRSSSSGSGKLDAVVMELDSFDSIKKGAAEFLKKSGNKCNILINNAGIGSCPEGTTKEGFETQFGTNHVGHFLLFQELKAALLASSTPAFNSRVVVVASSAHRVNPVQFGDYSLKKQGYLPYMAYGQSKTANIYFASELDRRYGSKGLHAWSLHPGLILTNFMRHMDPKRVDEIRESESLTKMRKTQEQGAATQVWAAVAKELEGDGGKYLDNVAVAEPMVDVTVFGAPGYAPHAYDEAAEKRLWVETLQMVGLPDDA